MNRQEQRPRDGASATAPGQPSTERSLRARAEAALLEGALGSPEYFGARSPEEASLLLHELQVHQIELEMQNEELRRAQVELDASRSRYFDLYDLAPVGYCTLSEKGLMLETNLTAAKLLLVDRGALVTQPISRFIFKEDQDTFYRHRKQLIETGDQQTCELRMVKKGGAQFWAHLTIAVAQDEATAPVLRIVLSDITERKKLEQQVHHMAFHDSLTKLPNRRLLADRMGQTLATAKRSACYGALMFLDLENFKQVNDRHGHEVGDLLLIEVADRLRNCVREMDTVARFGGDEFVVMISDLSVDKSESVAQALGIAEKIRAALAQPYALRVQHEETTETIFHDQSTVSIGVTLFGQQDAGQDDILRRADAAMYQAKDTGGNLIRFYDRNP